jgi:hypothetical protein
MVRQDNALFMELQLLRTMDQALQLDLGLYFHIAMLVTTSWLCFVPLGRHWFHSQSLLWPPVLVPSHPGLATFCPCWTHSLVLTWFPWNCRVNGVWCLDPMPLQVSTLCGLHSVYNDKVSEIGEVPKLLDRLLDASTCCLGVPISPGGSNRTICVGPNCCIIYWTIPCLNCDCWIWLGGNWRLIWKSPNVCLAIWCHHHSPCCNVISQHILMQHWQWEFSVFCAIYCLYAPVYVGILFLDNACLIFLQH